MVIADNQLRYQIILTTTHPAPPTQPWLELELPSLVMVLLAGQLEWTKSSLARELETPTIFSPLLLHTLNPNIQAARLQFQEAQLTKDKEWSCQSTRHRINSIRTTQLQTLLRMANLFSVATLIKEVPALNTGDVI